MRLAIALLFIASTAHADDTNNDEVWIGGGARALHSTSANALTGNSLSGSWLGYARDLGYSPVPGLGLWAEAGVSVGTAKGTLFQTMATDITAASILVGVRASYQLHRHIAATARLDLGVQHASVSLDDGSTTASDGGWGATTQAAIGVELLALDRPPFGLGVRIEYGYELAQSIGITPRPDRAGDALQLPMTEYSLGRLDLTGKTVSMALVGQF